MYLQITTRCNMRCAHCCMSATKKGVDMSMEVFKAAINFDTETVSIGGGEPTVHPQFWEMMGYAIGHVDYVWLATNGKLTDTAVTLAKLAERGVIGCALSIDDYHEEIDTRVQGAFNKQGRQRDNDSREIRNVSSQIMARGRGRNIPGAKDECCCSELFVLPNGDIKACGCEDAPLVGNVFKKLDMPDNWEWGECWKNQPSVETE